jgi:hypothetical protein
LIANIMELVPRTLYDSIKLPMVDSPIQTSITFFNDPWHVDVTSRKGYDDGWRCTYLHSNVPEQPLGKYGQQFLIQRINTLFLQDGIPLLIDRTDLYAKTKISFLVNGKMYAESLAILCPSPFALFGTPKEDLAFLERKYGIPWHKVPGTLLGESFDGDVDGVLINKAEMFEVNTIVNGSIPAGIELVIHLDGPLLRPLQ